MAPTTVTVFRVTAPGVPGRTARPDDPLGVAHRDGHHHATDDDCVSGPASDGGAPVGDPQEAQAVVTVDDSHVLALSGRVLPASGRRVLDAFGSQVGLLI